MKWIIHFSRIIHFMDIPPCSLEMLSIYQHGWISLLTFSSTSLSHILTSQCPSCTWWLFCIWKGCHINATQLFISADSQGNRNSFELYPFKVMTHQCTCQWKPKYEAKLCTFTYILCIGRRRYLRLDAMVEIKSLKSTEKNIKF